MMPQTVKLASAAQSQAPEQRLTHPDQPSTQSRPASTLDELFHAPVGGTEAQGSEVDQWSESDGLIQSMLRLMRTHLGLDVAFISHLTDETRTFRYVDAASARCIVQAGHSDPAEQSYCAYVVRGELPEFLLNPAEHPLSAGMPATHELPVGTHLSVPIVFDDGTVYGTLCAFSHQVQHERNERDLGFMRMLAAMIAGHVEQAETQRRQREQAVLRLTTLEVGRDLKMVFQPIVALGSGRTVGLESLARFSLLDGGPAAVFAEAWELGVGSDLELLAAQAALDRLSELPSDWYLAINVSPATLTSEEFLDLLARHDPARLVVEITEHAAVRHYSALQRSREALRQLQTRLAIDDVGTGFSGLEHILRLEPDLLKLDGALVEGVDQDTGKQAMISALVSYATRTGTGLIAERIETPSEHQALAVLGVTYGQGYYFARPDEVIHP